MAKKPLTAVIQDAYLQDLSTRSVDDLIKAMGVSGTSKSQVSQLPLAQSRRRARFQMPTETQSTEKDMATASTTIISTETPSIYVACLAAYNNGILHGHWIDVGEDAWGIWDGIRRMLAGSPIAQAEEWAIHDYEGFFGIRLSEYEGIERVAELATFLSEHGALGAELYSHFGNDRDEAREAMTERYYGCYGRLADYMEEITEECIAVPQQLAYYIDYEAMGRDAEMSGDILTSATAHDEVHVFAGC